MRPLFAIAATLILSGCGAMARTVIDAPAVPAADFGVRGPVYRPGADIVVSPVFDDPPARVLAACVLACDSYCHDRPDVVDEAAGHLHVLDLNAWTGAVELDVYLVAVDDGRTRVDMTAQKWGLSDRRIGQRRMRDFLAHVARSLSAAHALITAAPPPPPPPAPAP